MYHPNLPFNENISALSAQIARNAIGAAYEKIGTPPFIPERAHFEDLLANILEFDHEGSQTSRLVNGSVAGSEGFTIAAVYVPEEYEGEPFKATARVLSLGLVRGNDSVAYRLFTGPETPPLLVDETQTEAVKSRFSNLALGSVLYYRNSFDERHLHTPTPSELQVVYDGLSAVRADLCVRPIMEDSADFAADDGFPRAAQWFRDRLHLLEK